MDTKNCFRRLPQAAYALMACFVAHDSFAARPHSGITAVLSGPTSSSVCTLLADKHFQCWGEMFSGIVDLAQATNFVDISMGEGFFCALLKDGDVVCAGDNSRGQLGDGNTLPSGDYSYVTVSGGGRLQNVVQISAGVSHVCALKTDHTVWCWGYNGNGQLGNYNVVAAIQPAAVQVVINDAAHDVLGSVDWISSGGNHTCIEFLPDPHGAVTGACWGYNAYGQLGSGSITPAERSPVTIVVPGPSGLEALKMSSRSLKAGFRHTCTLIGDSAACWGDNNRGATSTGIGGNTPIPATVIISDGTTVNNIAGLSVGYDFSCLRFADTTGACWGADDRGQIGNYLESRSDVSSPVGIVLFGGSQLSGISTLVSGYAHTCALMQNARVYCWGDNQNGQLTPYPFPYSDIPIEIGDGPIFTDDFEG
jgi:alpha-tubulin suppressor-like RCC1 family protein